MAFEALKAEIALLFETMADTPHDRYELYIQIKEKLNEMRAFGMTPPDDLVEMAAALDEEFSDNQHPVEPPHSP